MAENNWANKTILIVEDNIINFKYLELALKNTEVNIVYAQNGQEALALFNNNPQIDLILMDINLPGISGYEVTEQIRRTNTTIPIIAQTGSEEVKNLQHCYDVGCNDCLNKPIAANVLIDKIKEYL